MIVTQYEGVGANYNDTALIHQYPPTAAILAKFGMCKVVTSSISPAAQAHTPANSSSSEQRESSASTSSRRWWMPRIFTLWTRFDLAVAIWILNYASHEEELLTMWRNILDSLKPGGRCVGILPEANQAAGSNRYPNGEK
ncbi:uncharacterized protein CDV56_109000 [Aspergillus thermomutatus]|uniref:Uncharacterized protein n=1 Tax=Aspergillus thermomutatus TaxID=41047 RepID=A0A397HVU2_ASPTH|nr:uncharacterized protein CDV56_109000 [Aspergillus thermomutatus]RHZ65686.1 hypothetical protein CDV56_109000 [Aspergillus thermomutatus]